MAKQNMHCGFRRTNIQTDAGQHHFLSRESIEHNSFNARSKDCEVSSDVWTTNSNNRCTILTFIAVEPTGHCRIVSVPLQCSDNTIPLGSGSANRHKAQKGPATNRSYFVRPVTGRSNFQHQSQNYDGLENKEDKATKRNSRKKPRKKGKRNKKLLISENSVSEPGCVNGCSTSEADANKSIDNRVGSCTADVGASESLVTSVPQDTHCKPIGSCDSRDSNVRSEPYDSTGLLDSMSLASNSDYSFNADDESAAAVDLSKAPRYASKKCSSPIEKREKQHIKRLPKNSSVYRGSNFGNLHGRFGKENSHSVWQRVERNDAADGCSNNSSTKLNSVSSQLDIGLKEEAAVLKKQSNVSDSDILSNTEDKSQMKLKLSGKMKRKAIKQDGNNYYARKESHAIKNRSNLGTRNNTKQNGISDTPAQISGQKEVDIDSSKVGCPRNEFQSKKVESVAFRPVRNPQVCELEPLESVYAMVSGSSISRNSVDPPELLEELVDEAKVIKQISSVDQTRQEPTSGTIMQKWVPVGVKDPEPVNSNQPQSLPMALQEESACGSQTFVSEEAVHVEECLILETEEHDNVSTAENDLSKMCCALNDLKRAQWDSEAIYMATGCPIAEFEKLLHLASPVICPSYNIVSCQSCSPDHVFGESLCTHETPNIALGNVWEWYEQHGCYGLEVRADDNENLKRLGMDSIAFRAYFVPSLSAVQLFQKCTGNNSEKRNEVPQMEARKSETCTSTGDLPILELLFEYFEPEQPQKRQPLFDTIKELVKGNGHSQCGAYGDPTTLESVGLNDLHPESWYSVAWYPIYRIPDGNLRAAFLTYHSLGHLVRRSSSSFDSLCGDVSIVSPVVGLQSYNAQGECWFRPRHGWTIGGEEGSSKLDPAGVLKERLRTLEHTASLMARGTVTKGTQTYINRQPDYEFFLSRRR